MVKLVGGHFCCIGGKMTTDQLLQLDCRVAENRRTIQKALRKMRPFSKVDMGEDVPLVKIEKVLRLMLNKYQVDITWIFVSHDDENMRYTISLRDDGGEGTRPLQTIYGITLYEVMCKTAICIWSLVKKGILKERSEVHCE